MPQRTEKIDPDNLERLCELWPRLLAWQRALIITHAVFFALDACACQFDYRAHYPAHWV